MFPVLDLYSLDPDPTHHLKMADMGCAVDDLCYLYVYGLYDLCDLYDIYGLYGLYDLDDLNYLDCDLSRGVERCRRQFFIGASPSVLHSPRPVEEISSEIRSRYGVCCMAFFTQIRVQTVDFMLGYDADMMTVEYCRGSQ